MYTTPIDKLFTIYLKSNRPVSQRVHVGYAGPREARGRDWLHPPARNNRIPASKMRIAHDSRYQAGNTLELALPSNNQRTQLTPPTETQPLPTVNGATRIQTPQQI